MTNLKKFIELSIGIPFMVIRDGDAYLARLPKDKSWLSLSRCERKVYGTRDAVNSFVRRLSNGI